MNHVLRFATLSAAILVPVLAGASTASAEALIDQKYNQLPMERSLETGTPLDHGGAALDNYGGSPNTKAQLSTPQSAQRPEGLSGSSEQSNDGELIQQRSQQAPMARSLDGSGR